ncbi:MAG: glycoside hydrolase [Acidiferrobacterales bacterium]|nr:glycoside hydrolase [Acidiferrobacterales bacterium]
MIRQTSYLLLPFVSILVASCGGGGESNSGDMPNSEHTPSPWEQTKANAALELFLSSEFNEPEQLAISTLAWEDGLNISRDGLHLYATYIPADLLSFVLNADTVENLQLYDRGPHLGADLVTNPTGGDYPWYHSDIAYSTRASIEDDFSAWQLSDMKRSSFSEGGLSAVFSDSNTIDILAFTSNEEFTAQNNIKIITNTLPNPFGNGEFITLTDTSSTTNINTNFIEDNPHIERLSASHLILFFDSEDRPEGMGGHDIWYAESQDNGATWTTPLNVTTINTLDKEHQPHLYNDGNNWWLYYSTYHTDNKLAIFRSIQQVANDWDSWGAPQIVLGAGTTSGIGEPSLTQDGDLCFVVIYENIDGTRYDRYDSDPWCSFAN